MVEACHFAPPWAVGIISAASSAAMVRNDEPPALAATMRATTSRGSADGRPRRTPWAFLTARASGICSPRFLSGLALRHQLAVPGKSAIAIVRANLRDRCAKLADCPRFALRAPKRAAVQLAVERRSRPARCGGMGRPKRSQRDFVDRSRSAQCASGGSDHRRNCHHCIKRQLPAINVRNSPRSARGAVRACNRWRAAGRAGRPRRDRSPPRGAPVRRRRPQCHGHAESPRPKCQPDWLWRSRSCRPRAPP